MAVHDWLDLRPGRGGGAPANFGALLKALHCMHNQLQLLEVIACTGTNSFIHPLVTFPSAHLTPFGLPVACEFFVACALSVDAAASPVASGTGVASREVTLAPPAAVETSAGRRAAAAVGKAAAVGGTSAGGGEVAIEAIVLVVMSRVDRLLVPDVGRGDRVDD